MLLLLLRKLCLLLLPGLSEVDGRLRCNRWWIFDTAHLDALIALLFGYHAICTDQSSLKQLSRLLHELFTILALLLSLNICDALLAPHHDIVFHIISLFPQMQIARGNTLLVRELLVHGKICRGAWLRALLSRDLGPLFERWETACQAFGELMVTVGYEVHIWCANVLLISCCAISKVSWHLVVAHSWTLGFLLDLLLVNGDRWRITVLYNVTFNQMLAFLLFAAIWALLPWTFFFWSFEKW